MSPPMTMNRRAVIQDFVQSGLAMALLPGAAVAAWRTVADAGAHSQPRALAPPHSRLLAAVAEAILPRTDTPSATDVGVVLWIDAVIADYFSDLKRAGFLAGLAALDEYSLSMAGAPLASLAAGELGRVIASLDAACGAKSPNPAQYGYLQLKELVVYGYFTSKPVQQDILEVPVIPGRFDPSVPITPAVK